MAVNDHSSNNAQETTALQSIKYDITKHKLEILNQLLLPHKVEYLTIESVKDGWDAIRTMKVRGAPAIAIVAVLCLSVQVTHKDGREMKSADELLRMINHHIDYLRTSRPTAVQLHNTCTELQNRIRKSNRGSGVRVDELINLIQNYAMEAYERDIADNKAIGKFGADWLVQNYNWNDDRYGKRCALTHCNTGSLATAGYGTALGIIRYLNELGQLGRVCCTETRPYNQGSRLTAFELVQDNLPNPTLICDDMVAALMSGYHKKCKNVDVVVVGADRIASNGDTANKIGTYQIALLANYHKIPFIVACPVSTIDLALESGAQIPIEERASNEMTETCGWNETQKEWTRLKVGVTNEKLQVWNPGFDYTPARLISAIVTEKGVFTKEPNSDHFEFSSSLLA